MGKQSFVKRQKREERGKREQRSSGCFECRAMNVGQRAFDAVYASYGLRSEPAPENRIVIPCVECGASHNFDVHGLTPEMKKEFSNLRRMADRDTRLRREWSDELKRLWRDFHERYHELCVVLYGVAYLEASEAGTQAVRAWLDANAEEMVQVFSQPPMVEQQKLSGGN